MNEQIPYSQNAEEYLLGALLIDHHNYHKARPILKRDDDLFIVRHQHILQSCARTLEQYDHYDYVAVAEDLKGRGLLDEIGGLPYLMQLINNVPPIQVELWAELVARAGMRRRLLTASEDVKRIAYDEDLPIGKVISDVETTMYNALSTGAKGHTVSLHDGLRDYYNQVEAIVRGDENYLGVPSGIKGLDELTRGAKRGQLIYVAARPGMGKTALILNMALKAARLGKRILLWSGEMSVHENIARLVSMDTGINSQKLENGNLAPDELSLFTEAALARLLDLPIHIDDTAYMTVEQLRSLCIRQQMTHGLDMVFVDYIGLLSSHRAMQNRNAEMGHYSRNLKRIAMELGVPVIAAAQLNRSLENRQDKRPILSDLRDSGELEQDASLVMFLYRDEVYNEATEHPGVCEIIVGKHRNGPTGTAFTRFDRPVMRFTDTTIQPVNLNGGNRHERANPAH